MKKELEKECIVLTDTFNTVNGSEFLDGKTLKNVKLSEGITTIQYYAFENCAYLEEIILPSSMLDIGLGAFKDCKNLKKIYIPDSVETIGFYAFEGCSLLSKVYLSKSLKKIELSSFRNCKELRSILIPENVKSIGKYAFTGCLNLKHVLIPASVTFIDDVAFDKGSKSLCFYVDSGSYAEQFALSNNIKVKPMNQHPDWEKYYIEDINKNLKEMNERFFCENTDSLEEHVDKICDADEIKNLDEIVEVNEKISNAENYIKDINENLKEVNERFFCENTDSSEEHVDQICEGGEIGDSDEIAKTNEKISNVCIKKKQSIHAYEYFFLVFILVTIIGAFFSLPRFQLIFKSEKSIETNSGVYIGKILNQEFVGKGEFQYNNGDVYIGEFEDSFREGDGKYYWENGDVFEGTWEQDNLATGTLHYANGSTYTGTFDNNTFNDGDFEGKIKLGQFGTFEGQVEDGYLTGDVSYQFNNGDSFKGEVSGERVEGVYTYQNGSEYNGTLVDGYFYNGKYSLNVGVLDTDLESLTVLYVNGKINNIQFKTDFGLVFDGAIKGIAHITYPSGNTYKGNTYRGSKEGHGTFTWINGYGIEASYTGEWDNDTMNGRGTYYYSSESYPCLKGRFVNGRPEGRATYYKEQGNTFTTTWIDGICTDVVES